MHILGVRVDNLERRDILEKISHFFSEDKFHQIATVNPEFILKAKKDEEFRNILNNCDLNIADGMGIKFAFWRLGEKLKCRMAGIDLMQEILKIADEKRMKIFLAANKRGLSSWEETRNEILRKYPNLEINGANLDILEVKLPNNVSDIVFCNFGAPFQEKFLNGLKNGLPLHLCQENSDNAVNKIKNNDFADNISLQDQRCWGKIKLAVGVGGSFDYLTGKLKRAPKWMQFFGVEWFWRLILQPKRIKRIFNAVIIFPIKVIFN
jgi:N-acetylglucosaminyldiphosphoundecaprenol N-acetyl-beta-D-mannosaminyltransferase